MFHVQLTAVGRRLLHINNHAVWDHRSNKKSKKFGLQWSKLLVQELFLKLSKCSLLINTNKSWKYIAKKLSLKSVKYPQWFVDALRTKGYVDNTAAQGRLIALLFQSFEIAFRVFLKKISPFSKRMKPNLSDSLSVDAKKNAWRNKTEPSRKKSSAITHFWKTHLNWREVVMYTSDCCCHWSV